MPDLATLNLKATAAMRTEDLRIARKHFVEAAARTSSPANDAAYRSALSWFDTCRVRAEQARAAVIRHTEQVSA